MSSGCCGSRSTGGCPRPISRSGSRRGSGSGMSPRILSPVMAGSWRSSSTSAVAAAAVAGSAAGGALLAAVADPGRGFDAIVVGEYERAFYGDQLLPLLPVLERTACSCGCRRRTARSILLSRLYPRKIRWIPHKPRQRAAVCDAAVLCAPPPRRASPAGLLKTRSSLTCIGCRSSATNATTSATNRISTTPRLLAVSQARAKLTRRPGAPAQITATSRKRIAASAGR